MKRMLPRRVGRAGERISSANHALWEGCHPGGENISMIYTFVMDKWRRWTYTNQTREAHAQQV